jgi:hypothetical protein
VQLDERRDEGGDAVAQLAVLHGALDRRRREEQVQRIRFHQLLHHRRRGLRVRGLLRMRGRLDPLRCTRGRRGVRRRERRGLRGSVRRVRVHERGHHHEHALNDAARGRRSLDRGVGHREEEVHEAREGGRERGLDHRVGVHVEGDEVLREGVEELEAARVSALRGEVLECETSALGKTKVRKRMGKG